MTCLMPAWSHQASSSLTRAGADPVAVVGVDVAHLARPAAVSVAHDPDVLRHRLAGQFSGEPPLVERVDQGPQTHHLQAYPSRARTQEPPGRQWTNSPEMRPIVRRSKTTVSQAESHHPVENRADPSGRARTAASTNRGCRVSSVARPECRRCRPRRRRSASGVRAATPVGPVSRGRAGQRAGEHGVEDALAGERVDQREGVAGQQHAAAGRRRPAGRQRQVVGAQAGRLGAGQQRGQPFQEVRPAQRRPRAGPRRSRRWPCRRRSGRTRRTRASGRSW